MREKGLLFAKQNIPKPAQKTMKSLENGNRRQFQLENKFDIYKYPEGYFNQDDPISLNQGSPLK